MAGAYHMVAADFWQDTIGWLDDERVFAIYLLTSPHRTAEGLFRLLPAYPVAELGWVVGRVVDARTGLVRREWLSFDEAMNVVLIRKALRWRPVTSPKTAKGAARKVADLASSTVFPEFVSAARRWSPVLADALESECPIPLRDGADTPSRTSEPLTTTSNTSSTSSSSTTSPLPFGRGGGGALAPLMSIDLNRASNRFRSAWLLERDEVLRLLQMEDEPVQRDVVKWLLGVAENWESRNVIFSVESKVIPAARAAAATAARTGQAPRSTVAGQYADVGETC